jgi:predicted phage baseplate assembly protein
LGDGRWQRLDPARGEVMDDTRSFTLDGAVRIKLPAPIVPRKLGHDPRDLFYLRCVFVAGAYDAAPELADVFVNAIAVEQAVMSDPLQTIRDGDRTWEVEALGTGRGVPGPQFSTALRPVVQSSFELFTIEGGALRRWTRRNDFDASKPDDCHFLLDPTLGTVSFGDGDKGRVPPDGAQVLAAYLATRAEAGNLAAGKITSLTDSPRNRALLTRPADPNYPSWESVRDRLAPIDKRASIGNAAASGGMAAETVSSAEARAMELIGATTRAVTLADYEELAAATPGTKLARVAAKANAHPAFPCLKAPGMIAVLILPSLPAKKPMPGASLLRVVTSYLRRRRIVGTRVEVFGPTYVEIVVRARVRASREADATSLSQRIIDALNAYFDPLTGGPNGSGWPFGRDVYRSEILALIARIGGVDYVVSLELALGTDGAPQCNNICLGPDGLVLSGAHQIEVLR